MVLKSETAAYILYKKGVVDMNKSIARYETFEYHEDEPFVLIPIEDVNILEHENLLLHWHEEMEIVYTVRGHAKYYIDGKSIDAGSGTVIATNPRSVHRIVGDRNEDVNAHPEIIVLIIHPHFLKEYFPQNEIYYFTNENTRASKEIANIMLRLRMYIKDREHGPFDHLLAKSMVMALLYHICKTGIVPREKIENSKNLIQLNQFRYVLTYIEEHYQEELNQDDVASLFYYSKSYFPKYFKKCTGYTFTEYVLRYRLQKARLALTSSNDSILDIALACGFSDTRRLIAGFKKYYGMTPAQYRRTMVR